MKIFVVKGFNKTARLIRVVQKYDCFYYFTLKGGSNCDVLSITFFTLNFKHITSLYSIANRCRA